ncbi:MAG: hypothetical protein KA717_38170 [Woronichinia naegeliana WA131]|uniref:Uncharacterized protein n=1 Tax=Woronichinia naegeliana WA131 TaxID=2824559 RepID=A0A977KWD7_9CYAN|nr:MAG: hypothetical protein KA717_38170 [Woronichinia naegeliana WA131]
MSDFLFSTYTPRELPTVQLGRIEQISFQRAIALSNLVRPGNKPITRSCKTSGDKSLS